MNEEQNEEFSIENCVVFLGVDEEDTNEDDYKINYLIDSYSYFESEESEVDLADYGYNESNANISISKSDTFQIYPTMSSSDDGNGTFYYDILTVQEVITTRTYTAEVDGEEVNYEWVTYKYLLYKTGTISKNNGEETDPEECDEEWVDTIIFEYIVRDKTTEELVDSKLLEYNEDTGEYVSVDQSETRCSDDPDLEKCCANCRKYLQKVMAALAQVSDANYQTYTPYIARVLGSWFRDTYFIIPETADTAIEDYENEVNRSSSEQNQIENSYGKNSTLVLVDEEYLADTEEYWTAYEMTEDGDYQLYYLNPDGTTSDVKMEDFLSDPYSALENYKVGTASKYNVTIGTTYTSQEEAEEAGHAFVKKAETTTASELSNTTLEDVVWSAYEFGSTGSSTGWIKIEYDDENEEVNEVYDIIGDDATNEIGGFYYKLYTTNSVTQIEDVQRSETNATVKWLFKYRKYYTYDGTVETAYTIAEDKEAVLECIKSYLKSEYSSASKVATLLGKYGRSALRQTYASVVIGEEWDDVVEEWLDWQLDMYYSGIIECDESYYKLDDLAFIVKTDEDGDIESITYTTNLDYTAGENEEVRVGDPRNPDLISTTTITKTSLDAFTILENTETAAAEYAYRDFKELLVELDYFDKEDLSDAVSSVFTWILPDIYPAGWPIRKWDKQDEDYGILIESAGTYDYLEEINYGEEEDEEDEETETTDTDDTDDTDEDTTGNMSIVSAAKYVAELVEDFDYGSSHIDLTLESSSCKETDCSGYVTAVLIKAGYFDVDQMGTREPSATEYWAHGTENVYSNPSGWSYVSSKLAAMEMVVDKSGGQGYVQESELQPGDIVAKASDESDLSAGGHVAIYMGNGTLYEFSTDGFKITTTFPTSKYTRAFRINSLSSTTTVSFEGYEGGEYVTSPVTGKVLEYGTHSRTNVYTGETEEVGYIIIEAMRSEYFTEDNVSDNSGDSDELTDAEIADALNLFYDEYEDTCAGYTIIIDGFDVDLNTTDSDGNNGTYEVNEVTALYNSETQAAREADEEAKYNAPFFINMGESSDLGSLPDEYECSLDGSDTGYYIKEGKYIGITYTDEEATSGTTDDYSGPANYIRIIVKDREYSVIDNVEDYFDIPDASETTITIYEGDTVEEMVWNALIEAGYSEIAAAAAMGNIYQESGFSTNNLQNEYEESLGYTDETYTEAVDNGTYSRSDFISDSAGYGLIQWTSSGRKGALYDLAKERGTSISDANTQIEELLKELEETWTSGDGNTDRARWKAATDLETAVKAYCEGFEGTSSAIESRVEAAERYLEKYGS